MNKRAGIGLAVIVAITFLIVGLSTIQIVKDATLTVRDGDNLNCAAPSGDGVRLLCLALGTTLFYWIGLIIITALGVVTAKFAL